VTLVDVAKKANVSIKTVSRVVNQEESVSDVTRQKVLAVIEELEFVPNIWAQRLRNNETRIVTLLFNDASSLYLMSTITGLIEIGRRYNYTVNLHSMDPHDKNSVDEVISLAKHKMVDGILITPPCDSSEHLMNKLHAMKHPFIQISPRKKKSIYPWISATDEQGAYEATRYLLTLGHRRIGYVQGDIDHQSSWERLSGYKSALKEAGIEFDDALYRQGNWSYKSGLREGRYLLTMQDPPSAIMGSDETVTGVIQAGWELGLHCPEDFSIVGYDDIPLAHQLTPPLTTVKQHISKIAQVAMTVLIEQLLPDSDKEISIEVPTELIIRGSTRIYDNG